MAKNSNYKHANRDWCVSTKPKLTEN